MKTIAQNVGKLAAPPSTTVSALRLGAIVGGPFPYARMPNGFHGGQIEPGRAAANVVKDTVGTGLATAAGAAVVTALGMGGLPGIVGFMTISGFSQGWWDAAVGRDGQTAAETPSMEADKDVAAP